MTKELGKRVFKVRNKLKISQAELAEKSEISKTYLGKFERGQIDNISICVITKIAHALGVTLNELFDGIEISDSSWESEDAFANALYQKKLEDACYPPEFERYRVTTLLQFLAYLPLLQPENILDSLLRIDGSFEGNESYILKQINFCVSRIPDSPAKEYANNCAQCLSRDSYLQRKRNDNQGALVGSGYEEYRAKIKQLDSFYKYYRMMVDNSIY
ncbi:MAG: helix-turn-helix transcriptional regulator [Oscillospiraceae bacterium]|nr:helix-turn-helix transcriptional regulator [Oscillospiraceae bacterium]